MLIMITYDLNKPGQEYANLFAAIQQCGESNHCLKSVWLLQTRMSVGQVQQILRRHMDSNDFLLVVDITGQSRDGWMSRSVWDWAREHDY